jgi:hypothetical protein
VRAAGERKPGHRSVFDLVSADRYPHFESTYPATRDRIAALVEEASVTEEDVRRVLFDNAAHVYAFDPAALQPHVDRVGLDLDGLRAGAPA